MISPLSSNGEQRAEIEKHVLALMEHFDAVQILVSSTAPCGGTESVFQGAGNWFARQGMAHDFIQRDQSETSASKIADKISPPPPDDGEEWKQRK